MKRAHEDCYIPENSHVEERGEDDDGSIPGMPQKKYFRSRAHCNPLSHNNGFIYPLNPQEMDWSPHFPNIETPLVRHLDIGCGYGGLTIALAKLYPNKVVLGLEIRAKIVEYVQLKIEALRKEANDNISYQNASCFRTNCQRYLPNYFQKGQLEKIFVCFPDPHFKAKNFRRRIISDTMLSEYAYFLKEGGRLYTVTDVEDLHIWHVEKCDAHVAFKRLSNAEVLANDPAVKAMLEETEEGKKVARLKGRKHFAVYEKRKENNLPEIPILSIFEVDDK